MSAHDVTYPPLDVLKPVADNVWIVDSGPHRIMGMPAPVRMTVVRLDDGDLWLHSPTRFVASLKSEMERHGRIRHLVAPNVGHWSYLKDWQRECPEAETWAAPGLRNRWQVKKSGIRLDHDLERLPPPAWSGKFEQEIVPGGAGFRETCFFHKPSRTLMLTDLIVNMEREKLPRLMRPGARLAGVLAPNGYAPIYLRALILARRADAATAAERLISLAPERVIFAHGRWYERDGAKQLRKSLAWLLP